MADKTRYLVESADVRWLRRRTYSPGAEEDGRIHHWAAREGCAGPQRCGGITACGMACGAAHREWGRVRRHSESPANASVCRGRRWWIIVQALQSDPSTETAHPRNTWQRHARYDFGTWWGDAVHDLAPNRGCWAASRAEYASWYMLTARTQTLQRRSTA